MSRSRRLLVIVLVFLPFLAASGLMKGLTHLDVISTNPVPFDGRALSAIYAAGQAELVVAKAKSDAQYHLTGTTSAPLPVDRHGIAMLPDERVAYTPFWLPFVNPVVTMHTEKRDFSVLDTAGVIGQPDQVYLARHEGSFVLMDEVLQSQASYNYGLFASDGRRAASAVYDATCGMLFRMQIKQPDKPDLRLKDTDFPISRNRNWLVIINTLFAALLLFSVYRTDRSAEQSTINRSPLFGLVALGMLCVATDTLLDIWHPFLFGVYAPVVWHLCLTVAVFVVRKPAAAPAIAELVMVGALWLYDKGPAPVFFYTPGLIVAFLLALRGRPRVASDRKLPRIVEPG